jgi:hypothetical protein
MSEINNLYDRNHRFAVGFDQAELAILPRFSTVILTCIDARVDPAHFLDLKLGDAIVLRNAGGRVTEAVERELAILFAIANQVADGELRTAAWKDSPVHKPKRRSVSDRESTWRSFSRLESPTTTKASSTTSIACGGPILFPMNSWYRLIITT